MWFLKIGVKVHYCFYSKGRHIQYLYLQLVMHYHPATVVGNALSPCYSGW